MKKTYEAPEIELEVLASLEDILTLSANVGAGGVTDKDDSWSEWLN